MKKIFFLFVSIFLIVVSLSAKDTIDSITSVKLLKLARKYKYGINTDVNMKKAISIYSALAKAGNVVGMRELGHIYLTGDSIKKNYKAAYNLFKKAADGGDVKSLCALADMYREGKGVPMDYYEAFSLYMKAADRGSSRGLYGVGYCFYKGVGVTQNYEQAVHFLKLGSQKGNSSCDMLLGNYYSHGYKDGNPDYEEAKKYYKQAINRGNGWIIDIVKKGVLDSVKRIKVNQETKWKNVKSLRMLNDVNNGFSGRKLMKRNRRMDCDSYSGKLYLYDWSGKYVEDEKDISLDLSLNDSVLSFNCYSDGVLYTKYVSDEYTCERWIKKRIREDEKKLNFIPVTVGMVSVSQDSLSILMEGMNPKNKEKKRPMLAVIKKDFPTNLSNGFSVTENNVSVSLSDGQLVLNIDAHKKLDVMVKLYSADGIRVFETKKELIEGNNCFRFDINVCDGTYVLRINGIGINYSKTIAYEI